MNTLEFICFIIISFQIAMLHREVVKRWLYLQEGQNTHNELYLLDRKEK